jgi:hypothetical protein
MTTNIIRRSLVLGLALAALTAGTARAGSTEYEQYEVTGAGPQGALRGFVRFGTDTSSFSVSFNAPRGAVGNAYSAAGNYNELDLLVIGFWSFQGNDGGGTARGSGSGCCSACSSSAACRTAATGCICLPASST